jgi:hypothetical protein
VSGAHYVAFMEIVKQITNGSSAMVSGRTTAEISTFNAIDFDDPYAVMAPRFHTPLVVTKAYSLQGITKLLFSLLSKIDALR